MKNLYKRVGIVLSIPFLLFFLLVLLLYLPPVQNWIVRQIVSAASEQTGMDISINRVRLVFPLDLGIDGFKAIRRNDSLPQLRDTIADVNSMVADVRLLPLLDGRVLVDKLELSGVSINTSNLVPAARVKGSVGRFYIAGRSVNMGTSTVDLSEVLLSDARIDVHLSDTVPPDTSTTATVWKILADNISLGNTGVTVHTPGDTMQVRAFFGAANVSKLFADLGKSEYKISSVAWHDGALCYDNNFEPRRKGLDFNHISLSDVNIAVDSIGYLAPDMRLNLRYCRLMEKSGLAVTRLDGPVRMDSVRLNLPSLNLRTPDSELRAEVRMDLNAMADTNPGEVYVRLFASLGKQDVMRCCSGMPQEFVRRYPNHPIIVKGSANGNMRRVDFTGLDINLPTAFHVSVNGYAANPTEPNCLKADVRVSARTGNLDFLIASFAPDMSAYHIPSGISLNGTLTASSQKYTAAMTLAEGTGNVVLDGQFDNSAKTYKAQIDIENLDIQHFMPADSIRTLNCSADIVGQGFDFFSKHSRMQANAEIRSLRYAGYDVDSVTIKTLLRNGVGNFKIDSRNALADGKISVDALLDPKKIDATLVTELNRADLHALRLTEFPFVASVCAHVDVASDMADYYKVQGFVNDLTIRDDKRVYRPKDVEIDMYTDKDTTWARMYSGNLELDMAASGGYRDIIGQGQRIATEIVRQTQDKEINQAALKQMLPTMRLRLLSGNDNPIANYLRTLGVDFGDFYVNVNSSSHEGLNGNMHVYSLVADSICIDTVRFVARQDSADLRFNGQVLNNKRNRQFVFNALIDGYVFDRGAELNLKYFDSSDRLGVNLGARAEMCDSGINVRLLPDKPVLGYKGFNLNPDNYVFLGRDKRVHARIDLIADDGTGVKVYSDDTATGMLQDLTVSLNRFDLEKITSVMPYAPRMTGYLGGDFHLLQNNGGHISVLSDMEIQNMVYEKNPMGDIATEFVYLMQDADTHIVDATISTNSRQVGSLNGLYKNTDAGYLDATFNMERLPLSMANGFIPDNIFGLEGYAEGSVSIKGALDAPVINGEVYLDSSYVVSVPYGLRMRIDNDPVRIVGSNLLLENFSMYGHNNNPLVLQGNIDFSNPDRMYVGMKMRGTDYLLVNSKQSPGSVAFGKAFVNMAATVDGNVDNLKMRGKLDVLGKTNITYVLKDSPLNTDDRLKGLVTFADFRDTTKTVTVTRPPISGLDMYMLVNIEQGARVRCDLNAAHSNYIELEGGGELRMTYNPMDDMRLYGRYTLNSGEMKYALPVIPLKTFKIKEGSYVEFTGDMMNPRLDLTATEQTKALVSSDAGSRSVLFDCGVKVTKTLADMGLEFTLDAPEDMTIKNELASMGADQRGKLAVTMLTTGMYLSDGNTGSFSMNDALNTFLQSEINSITNNAMRTVDLSLGLDQSSDAAGNTHTDYSFKFAKRFWNNRVNFVIGGKLSSGASGQSTQSGSGDTFIDNVSLEYRLDETAMRYVRLFYNKEADDLLEGQVSEYGAGLVLRKKMNRIGELFDFRKKKAKPLLQSSDTIKLNGKK